MDGKLQDTHGETIIEVLAAVLIGALSVAMLFGAVMVSSHMDRTAEETEKAFVRSLNDAEGRILADGSAAAGAKVTVESAGRAGKEVSVIFYGGEGAISYALNTSPP